MMGDNPEPAIAGKGVNLGAFKRAGTLTDGGVQGVNLILSKGGTEIRGFEAGNLTAGGL
jgi:hypothetical protein